MRLLTLCKIDNLIKVIIIIILRLNLTILILLVHELNLTRLFITDIIMFILTYTFTITSYNTIIYHLHVLCHFAGPRITYNTSNKSTGITRILREQLWIPRKHPCKPHNVAHFPGKSWEYFGVPTEYTGFILIVVSRVDLSVCYRY